MIRNLEVYEDNEDTNPKGRRRRRSKDKFTEEREGKAKPIVAKTENQIRYLKALNRSKLVIAEGKSGTGKTFVASSFAANCLLQNKTKQIILSRAYVPMGRSVGLLPGTIVDKLSIFLAPMMNNIKKVLGVGAFESSLGKTVLIQPLEAIRGMSFEDSILLLDEAQNLTVEEVKSVVTRIGEGTQLILCGDTAQTDIKGENGLTYLKWLIRKYNISDCDIIEFTSEDIVRSGMVKEFVMAFDSEGELGSGGNK